MVSLGTGIVSSHEVLLSVIQQPNGAFMRTRGGKAPLDGLAHDRVEQQTKLGNTDGGSKLVEPFRQYRTQVPKSRVRQEA
jgi:hypothetical protein